MGNDLSTDLLLCKPFSSPAQTVTLDDDTTLSSIITSPIRSAENENITLNKDDIIFTNVHHLTSRFTSLVNNDGSQLSLLDLINDMSHLSIYSEDDLSIYEIGSVDRQDRDLIFDSGCTHHMVQNLSLLTNITFNDRIDTLNLGSVRLGSGLSLPITGYGDLWPFRKVLLVAGLQHNYISYRILTHRGFSIYLIEGIVTIADWCSLKIIMRSQANLGDIYRLIFFFEKI